MTEKDYFSLIKQEQLNKAIEELKNNKFPVGFLNLIDQKSPFISEYKRKEVTTITKNSTFENWVHYIITYIVNDDKYSLGYQMDLDIKNGNLLKILLMLQNKIKKAE